MADGSLAAVSMNLEQPSRQADPSACPQQRERDGSRFFTRFLRERHWAAPAAEPRSKTKSWTGTINTTHQSQGETTTILGRIHETQIG
ncbi:hypothetical protein [Cohnella sp. REN36]|uniref:hypothetical protein n=1 Tax=Cohnella sp. REN36 TaxID=2887347 RepID=UPI001D14ABD6|nr:hypothetical protein [Cohnella sp. REN36]MCC3373395.1 hypothetical protein [Cohnella sp. REN36]